MLFDSLIYFVFLIPVVLAYWQLTYRRQNVFLLFASYFFYGWWDWRFLALMVGSTTMDFLIAQKISAAPDGRTRKHWLIFSLVLNFGILGLFKYFNFFVDSFAGLLATFGVHHFAIPLIRILLPPGISFYTFQEVAYIVEVFKGRIEPARSFVDYALFISLFPHLIAGPIQRPSHLLPQVQKEREFDANPNVDFLGGKVLPCWVSPPAPWLTREHWAPLALLDYGDQSFYVDAAKRLCLIGANFAFRRRVFDELGMFKTDFQRVKDGIGSLEDHEMLLRLWHANRKGLYFPHIIVTAEIESERLQKSYHRRWHAAEQHRQTRRLDPVRLAVVDPVGIGE